MAVRQLFRSARLERPERKDQPDVVRIQMVNQTSVKKSSSEKKWLIETENILPMRWDLIQSNAEYWQMISDQTKQVLLLASEDIKMKGIERF